LSAEHLPPPRNVNDGFVAGEPSHWGDGPVKFNLVSARPRPILI